MYRTVCWAVCGVACLALIGRAQSPPQLLKSLENPLDATSSGSRLREQDAPENPGLIVTTTGALIEGRIQRANGGYMVHRGGGYLHIPFQSIKMTAVNRHDAYRKYRALMPEKTPRNHVVLAQWCLTHGLQNDARVEIEAALLLDPEYADAIALLRAIDSARLPDGVIAGEKFDSRKDADDEPRDVSLFGLSVDTVGEYTAAIQPILMNNCANAGCHNSGAKNDLKLHYVRLTGYQNRLWSRQNLESVLSQVAPERPEESPLLVRAGDLHAGTHKSLRNALHGKEMLARLDRWVHAVSRERQSKRDVGGSLAESSPTRAENRVVVPHRNDAFDPTRFNSAGQE